MMPGADIVSADARAHCREQDHQQLAAMDRVLRPVISGSTAARFRPDQLAVLVEISKRGRLDCGLGQLLAEPELAELAYCVGLQIDPNPERPQGDNGFVDATLDAGGVQAERGC